MAARGKTERRGPLRASTFPLCVLVILLNCILFGSAASLLGQEQGIDSLSREKGAVVVLDESEFVIKNQDRATWEVHRVIRVFEEKGKKYGRVVIPETRFEECDQVSGRITDETGKVIRKLEKEDVISSTVSYGSSLHDDTGYKWFQLEAVGYPYTLDYRYKVNVRSLLAWPDWYPQQDIPVSRSTYRLEVPDHLGYRVHSIGIQVEPGVLEKGNRKTLTWDLENIEPLADEEKMPPEDRVQMALKFAPEEFSVYGHEGSFGTWEGFGSWCNSLYSGQYELTQSAQEQIERILAGASTEREKIQMLYRFLQNGTRYVAIELGIGGWQPYPAQEVFDNRYGDCKDLSTLMVSMLRHAGIEAYPALVKTRNTGVVRTAFPSNQFNHCITFIPMDGDTVWLECTQDYLPAGELPSDDEGCDVLVLMGDTCEFIRTPESASEDNRWSSRIEGTLLPTGTLRFSGTLVTTGNQSLWMRSSLIPCAAKERDRWLSSQLGSFVPKLDLMHYEMENLDENLDRPFRIAFEGSIDRFSARSGSRLFVNPAILQRVTTDDVPDEDESERKFPVYYSFAYYDVDSVTILLPEGFTIESAPQPQNIHTEFGSYRTTCEISDGILAYSRRLEIRKKLIPFEAYGEYLTFIKSVAKTDQQKFVFAAEQ